MVWEQAATLFNSAMLINLRSPSKQYRGSTTDEVFRVFFAKEAHGVYGALHGVHPRGDPRSEPQAALQGAGMQILTDAAIAGLSKNRARKQFVLVGDHVPTLIASKT